MPPDHEKMHDLKNRFISFSWGTTIHFHVPVLCFQACKGRDSNGLPRSLATCWKKNIFKKNENLSQDRSKKTEVDTFHFYSTKPPNLTKLPFGHEWTLIVPHLPRRRDWRPHQDEVNSPDLRAKAEKFCCKKSYHKLIRLMAETRRSPVEVGSLTVFIMFIPSLFTRIYMFQVVQDFFHQRYGE